jgi:hypothetical protein
VTHLTPDELVDAAEGTLDGRRLHHIAICKSCRRELDALAGVMHDAAPLPVPEPSPLFWDHFSARVRAAIEAEGVSRDRASWHHWLGWRTLLPAAAAAAVVLAFAASVPRIVAGPPKNVGAAEGRDPIGQVPEVFSEGEWGALADIVGSLDWETAAEAGLTLAPGDADAAMLDLDDDERRELSHLVTTEGIRLKS